MSNNKHLYDPGENEPLPEGEEAPPPLVHTMAIVRWGLLIGLSLFALIMILNGLGFAPWEARADNATQYHCPMHPTYISNQPGECPICGMSLVPIDKSGKEIKQDKPARETAKEPGGAVEQSPAVQYVCPMHPDVVSDKPGSCPKCGMDLVKMESMKTETAADSASTDSSSVAAPIQYTCPMHPEVISDKPGSCPKCGMDLVPMKPAKAMDSMSKSQEPTVKGETKAVKYVCPMHSQIISDKPGRCPICGMSLEPVVEKRLTKPVETKIDKSTLKSETKAAKYYCPMHPEITSDKPGRCPICNMFLEPVKADTTKAAPKPQPKSGGMGDMGDMPGMSAGGQSSTKSDMGEAPVPGLVPVTIEPERLQLINVRTAPVERQSLGSKIDIVGFVTPDETRLWKVNTRISGWVTELFVNETGQYVEAGKPLFSLYSQDLFQAEQDLKTANDALTGGDSADVALMKMRWEIYFAAREKLHLLGLSESQIDALEKLDSPSQQMTIKSPYSGYVLEKNALSGQYITPDQDLFTIADLSKIWVIGDVYEQDMANIHAGQGAVLRLPAFQGETFSGTISYLYPAVSEKTRTMKVKIEFSNPGLRIRPGMYAQVELASGKGSALSIPNEAILDNGDIKYAFVVHTGGHFEPRKITTGRTSDDWTEVIGGLHEGEMVVTSANFLIDSESRLKAAVSGMATMPGMPDMPAEGQATSQGQHVH